MNISSQLQFYWIDSSVLGNIKGASALISVTLSPLQTIASKMLDIFPATKAVYISLFFLS